MPSSTTRRSALASVFLAPLLAGRASLAAESSASDGPVSASELASRLRAVPTFALVDKRGVPFTVFGADAKVTCYFFTTYGEASRVLSLAKRSSDKALAAARSEVREKRKKEGLPRLSVEEENAEVGINPWTAARISSVPLDTAVTLVTRSQGRSAGVGVYFKVAPAESDVDDALDLDSSGKKKELAEGKVPLFYIEDFLRTSVIGGKKESPLYFRKAELLAAWNEAHPEAKKEPEVKVTELFSTLAAMVDPNSDDAELGTVVFVPPMESADRAKECAKIGGKEDRFRIGERIVVM